MNKRSLSGTGMAVALTLAVAGVARADDASDKAQLEQRVQDLERELADVKSSLRGGYFTANSDLEARVGELERVAGDGAMSSAFKSGLKHSGGDGAFSYQVFGLIQNDWLWYGTDSNRGLLVDDAGPPTTFHELNEGVEFRRIRLGMNGTMYGNVKWHSEVELSKNDVKLADVWMQIAVGGGALRIGHMKEPIGFDQITSDRYTHFMERSFVNSLSPGRNTGFLYSDRMGDGDDAWLVQFGIFRDADSAGDDLGNAVTSEYNFSGRVAGRPMIDDDGTTWLHVGASARWTDISDDAFSLKVGPAINQAQKYLSAAMGADESWQAQLELAFVTGPLTFLAEYAHMQVDATSGTKFNVNAMSVEGAYWLTGENTAYDKDKGTFGRTMPRSNYGDDDGDGAWQLAARYDRIDLDDGGLGAGDADQITVGCRWWLNPNTAIHFNVIRFHPDDPANALHGETLFGMRFEIDF